LAERSHAKVVDRINIIDFQLLPSLQELSSENKSNEWLKEIALIKHIKYNKAIEQNASISRLDHERKTLILTRILGHKVDIPGSAQWNMITARVPKQTECYICDKQIYSIIFWNTKIGAIEI
jgi:hypothetical protein